jgi:lipoprotein-anchoring transpeptidase ErfK/SrfK
MPGGSWDPPRSRRLRRVAIGLAVAAAVVVPPMQAGAALASKAQAVMATGVPAHSGSGRRIVYDRAQQRVWAIDAHGQIVNTHRVSGRLHSPAAGTYHVYSRSRSTYSIDNPAVIWNYMVRFAKGPGGGNIGFHEIPTKRGRPLQSTAQLGQPLSAGCVRQSHADALWIWNWAGVGTKVVVL